MAYKLLTPIEPMLASYAAGEDVYDYILQKHNGLTFAELKYDGYRLQLHKKGDEIKGFTRSLNEVPLDVYPELTDSIKKLPDCILDCELNGGIGHNGFKVIQKRFRLKPQKNLEAYLSNVDTSKEVELRVFDTLYWNDNCKKNSSNKNNWLMDLPLSKRRLITEKISENNIHPTQRWIITKSTYLEDVFNSLIGQNNEGLVCKDPASLYIPGDNKNWFKLKKFETLDLTVLGVYLENNEVSQLLCGSYNNERNCFETLAKVNAKREGIGKDILAQIQNKFEQTKPNSIIIHPSAKTEDLPNAYVNPLDSVVVEIKAMNIHYTKNWHSCGIDENKPEKTYSLRIAWVKTIRDDKKPIQSTTTKKVGELYKMQEG